MDIKVLLSTFGVVFLAEMGDKTQLATMGMAAGSNRWAVFLGASLALIAASALGVLAGGVIAEHVSPRHLQIVAGLGFVAIGLWTLFRP